MKGERGAARRGVKPAAGSGQHDGLAGTHNTLLRLGAPDERRYLEIIAIDADAGAPSFRAGSVWTARVQREVAPARDWLRGLPGCAGMPDAIERFAATPGYATRSATGVARRLPLALRVHAGRRAHRRWRVAAPSFNGTSPPIRPSDCLTAV